MNHSKTMPGVGSSVAARAFIAVGLAGLLAAGCGAPDRDEAAARKKQPEQSAAAKVAQEANAASAAEAKKYEKLANAVVTSKSAAAVDLKYDVLSKPEVGLPFEVVLNFLPRLPADQLEVEIGDMPGITILGERAVKFAKVGTVDPYTAHVQVRADAAGLYYLSVIAKMVTQVQTEARTFSIPVVVGTLPPAAQKPAPQTDSTGQAIESMPAKES